MSWINVNERKPVLAENDHDVKRVFVLIDNRFAQCADYIKHTDDETGKFYISYKNHFDDVTTSVTHWMYVPSSLMPIF